MTAVLLFCCSCGLTDWLAGLTCEGNRQKIGATSITIIYFFPPPCECCVCERVRSERVRECEREQREPNRRAESQCTDAQHSIYLES